MSHASFVQTFDPVLPNFRINALDQLKPSRLSFDLTTQTFYRPRMPSKMEEGGRDLYSRLHYSVKGVSELMNMDIPFSMICFHIHRGECLQSSVCSFDRISLRMIRWNRRVLHTVTIQHLHDNLVVKLFSIVGKEVIGRLLPKQNELLKCFGDRFTGCRANWF